MAKIRNGTGAMHRSGSALACLCCILVISTPDLEATGIRGFLGSDRQAPGFSGDGRSVALVFGDPAEFVIVTLDSRSVARYPLPGIRVPVGVVWLDGKLLVASIDPPLPAPAPAGDNRRELLYWVFDPKTGDFGKSQLEPHIVLDPFLVRHLEKSWLYAPDMDSKRTRKLEWPSLAEIGTLEFEAASIGDGWMMRERSVEERYYSRRIVAVEVCDAGGGKVGSIPAEELARAAWGREARFPACGILSPDRKQILLGFGTGTIFRQHSHEYTFGVFSVEETGKLLWKGSSNWLLGTPVLAGERIYSVEAEKRERHTGDRAFNEGAFELGGASEPTSDAVFSSFTKEGREVVLKLPLDKADLASKYGASKDRDHFVVLVEGPKPRLLVIPIRRDVKLEDVREVDLRKH